MVSIDWINSGNTWYLILVGVILALFLYVVLRSKGVDIFWSLIASANPISFLAYFMAAIAPLVVLATPLLIWGFCLVGELLVSIKKGLKND